MRTKRRAKVTRTLLAVLVVGTLAACGGGGGDDEGVASLDTDDNAAEDDGGDGADDGDSELTDAEREDAMLEFTECMREHGVDMPDPDTGGGDGPVIMRREAGSAADEEEFEEAQEACGSIMEDAFGDRPERDPEEEAEMQDNALAYAQCMREHGIDFPDPDFSEGGVAMRLGDGIDPEDPDFIEAEEECQPLLGFEDGEGPTRKRSGGGGSESGPSNESSES
jgi:hypothetical protein